MDGDDPAVAIGAVLELPPLSRTAVVGPLAAGVWRRLSQMITILMPGG
jgi:hypothetical protein